VTRVRADIALTAEDLRRPPLRSLRLTVELRSGHDAPLWVLVPDRTGAIASPGPVQRVELYALDGATVVALRDAERGAFGVLLGPRAAVTLHGLPVAHWGDRPSPLVLDVTSATGLRLDGEAVSGSPVGGTLDASPLADQRAVVEALGGIGSPPVAVHLVDPEIHPVTVSAA
jgi:hypothetical protein